MAELFLSFSASGKNTLNHFRGDDSVSADTTRFRSFPLAASPTVQLCGFVPRALALAQLGSPTGSAVLRLFERSFPPSPTDGAGRPKTGGIFLFGIFSLFFSRELAVHRIASDRTTSAV